MGRPLKSEAQRRAEAATNRELGARLRKALDEAGLTDVALAEDVSISKSMMSRILKGERRPSLEKIAAIEDRLRLARGYLLGGQAAPAAVPAQKAAPVSKDRLPPGLAEYLERHGDRIAPVVVRHMKGSHFQTDNGVALDEAFWARQQRDWEEMLLSPRGSGAGSGKPQT